MGPIFGHVMSEPKPRDLGTTKTINVSKGLLPNKGTSGVSVEANAPAFWRVMPELKSGDPGATETVDLIRMRRRRPL
jgi:hypothetical protein